MKSFFLVKRSSLVNSCQGLPGSVMMEALRVEIGCTRVHGPRLAHWPNVAVPMIHRAWGSIQIGHGHGQQIVGSCTTARRVILRVSLGIRSGARLGEMRKKKSGLAKMSPT